MPGTRKKRIPNLANKFRFRGFPTQSHFYLNTVGVVPNLAGQGHGGTIIRHTLDLADSDGQPCYLESSSPRNIPLYERLGFEVISEIALPNGPTMWGMWRSER